MVRRLLYFLAVILVLAGVAAVGYWGWREAQEERRRETGRERSFKEAAWRFKDEKTGQVFLRLDALTQHRVGLAVEPATPIRWQRTLTLPGFTVPVPHRRAELRSPWTGTLQAPSGETMPTVGQRVRKGQVLGVLLVPWSPTDRIQLESQFRDAQGAIGETEAELRVARSTTERLRKLGSDALPAKQLMEAEGNLARLEARLNTARARERILTEVLAKKDSDVTFPFTALQDGELTEVARRPGEVVAAGDLVAAIYDPRELWVNSLAMAGQLGPADAPPEAEVRFPGLEREAGWQPAVGRQVANLPHARLVQIKPQIDRQQQALELIYSTENPQGRIPMGLQAEVSMKIGRPIDAITVPRSALLRRDEQRLVYIERLPGEFIKQVVEVLAEDATHAYLRATLHADVQVVSRGAQVLLSEEYKESIQLVEEKGATEEDQE